MTPQKTITLNGQQVKMIYCAATENGFEDISNQSINVFFPTFGKDKKGNDIIVAPPKANQGHLLTLALAGIVAAYAKDDEQPPIDGKYILYEATPQERNDLLTSINELRAEWYTVPKTVEETIRKEAKGKNRVRKNA